MSSPEGYLLLQGLSTAGKLFDRAATYSDQTSQVYAQYDAANRQAAINNQTSYNSFLHLGAVQQLEAKKYAISLNELYRVARRTRASEKVLAEQQGGSASNTGIKRLQVLDFEASQAAHRKNENFETVKNDFIRKRDNITMETLSANNKAFSGLSALPSKTGLVTGIAGDLIDAKLSIGYGIGRDGKIFDRFTE